MASATCACARTSTAAGGGAGYVHAWPRGGGSPGCSFFSLSCLLFLNHSASHADAGGQPLAVYTFPPLGRRRLFSPSWCRVRFLWWGVCRHNNPTHGDAYLVQQYLGFCRASAARLVLAVVAKSWPDATVPGLELHSPWPKLLMDPTQPPPMGGKGASSCGVFVLLSFAAFCWPGGEVAWYGTHPAALRACAPPNMSVSFPPVRCGCCQP